MADIPAAIPLTNANVNVPPAVGAILPDGVPTAAQVEQETQHLRGIKRGRDLGVVTAEELGGRVARHHAIVAKHAGPEAAPVWAAPLIANIANMSANIANITANIDTMNMRLLSVAATSESTMARLHNQRLMGGDEVLQIVHKMVAGIPTAVPAWAPNEFIMPAFLIVPPVNATPQVHNVHYPQTVGAIYELTCAQIAALSVFYNDGFGLAPRDTSVGVQRFAFARFVGR